MLQLTRGEALLLCAACEEGFLPSEAECLHPTVEEVLSRDTPTLLSKLKYLNAEDQAELLAAVKRFQQSAKQPADERLRKAGLISV